MNMEVVGPEIGIASAIKMCRSIVVKGLEALAVECLATARAYGVEERVTASLDQAFPGLNWPDASAYMIGRVIAHGTRRAEEMRRAAATVRAIGLEPVMSEAIAARQQSVADLGLDAAGASDPHAGNPVDALIAPGRAMRSE
jgi:3-hydroxyisobutyrate dehydrogenase-like beta-hydroxyacid dehydrogenase